MQINKRQNHIQIVVDEVGTVSNFSADGPPALFLTSLCIQIKPGVNAAQNGYTQKYRTKVAYICVAL